MVAKKKLRKREIQLMTLNIVRQFEYQRKIKLTYNARKLIIDTIDRIGSDPSDNWRISRNFSYSVVQLEIIKSLPEILNHAIVERQKSSSISSWELLHRMTAVLEKFSSFIPEKDKW